MLNENERLDDLQINNLKVIQNTEEFCFGTDAVLLANYAKIKNNAKVIDLGTGTGVIPILLSAKSKAKEITGLEIQPKMCEMASRSIELNNLKERIKIIQGDIKNVKELFERMSFDNVVTNPPYVKGGAGLKNKQDSVALARHEIMCSLEDVINATSYLLKNGGRLSMVHRPDRIVDVLYLLRKNHIEPKEIRFVQPFRESAANMFLINAVKGARPFLKFHDPLIVRNDDGSYTKEINEIYGIEGGLK